jgi:DNA repair photolyase
VRCKTLLHRLDFGRGPAEYTANMYRGCIHGCVYCYAPSLVHDTREWGRFVDAKVNAPAVLRRELRVAARAPVFLSSASDPYQPVEARYRLTRRCLEELYAARFPVIVLTRSPLVLRDLEILKRFGWARVGCSISSASGRFCEPGVPPLERRLETLRALGKGGVRTWVSLAPLVPGIVTTKLEELISRIRDAGVSCVTTGLLRFQGYGESKEMFERSTGMSSEVAMAGGAEVLATAKLAISERGFEDPEEFFDWKLCDGRREVEGAEADAYAGGLDEFVKPEVQPSAEAGGLYLAHASRR